MAGAIVVLSLLLGVLGGCGATPSALSGGNDLPTLHRLDWGFPYVENAAWSPDGRWIAVAAGNDSTVTHLEVVSSDGQTRYDLSGWQCGNPDETTFAWLPDGRLSCLTSDGYLKIGAAPFRMVQSVHVSRPISPWSGGAWAPDGSYLLFMSASDPFANGSVVKVAPSRPYAVTLDGVVHRVSWPTELDTLQGNLQSPEFAPGGTSVAFVEEPDTSDPNHLHPAQLVLAPITRSDEQWTVGNPQVIANGVDQWPGQTYSWSPSGHWLAVRHADYRSGDKIYLLNPQRPSQTVDVVLADQVGQQMMSPIWSPDGKTLIVFSVAYGVSYPYAIDIASYLHSKGLQP